MTTVKVKFRPSMVSDRPGTIIYVVNHHRIVRRIVSDCRVFSSEWDERRSKVTAVHDGREGSAGRADVVRLIARKIRQDLALLHTIVDELGDAGAEFTSDEIVSRYHELMKERSFKGFTEGIIAQLKRLDKERTSETYVSALRSFMRFRADEDISLHEVDSDLMMGYEAWLKANGVSMNTISFYNRILRAVYNRAVEKGLTAQCYPFRHVYTGIGKTVKRAITLKDIRCVKELDLSSTPSLDFARDMFLFAFYTRGMSFVDMAYLKKSDLQNGFLSYRRRKTGQLLLIKWERHMQEILSKYDAAENHYLLPIIKATGDERKQYRNALHLVNKKLKEISALAGLHVKLTMYVSRHSWASIAKSHNVPLSVISDGMGHDSETTTQIYLALLDNSIVDKANKMILSKI